MGIPERDIRVTVSENSGRVESIALNDNSINIDVKSVEKYIPNFENSLVVITSTLLEGIGNRSSDVDVYYVSQRLLKLEDLPIDIDEYYWVNEEIIKDGSTPDNHEKHLKMFCWHDPKTGIRFDVECLTFERLDAIFKSIEEEYACQSSHTVEMTSETSLLDIRVVHRTLKGIPIRGDQEYRDHIVAQVSMEKLLFLLYRHAIHGFQIVNDIIGNFKDQKFELASFLANRYLFMEMMAFSHLGGNSNPNEKWLLSWLSKCEGHQRTISEEFKYLYFRENQVSHKQYTLDVFKFISKLFKENRSVFDESPVYPTSSDFLEMTRQEYLTYSKINDEILMDMYFRSCKYLPGFGCISEMLTKDMSNLDDKNILTITPRS